MEPIALRVGHARQLLASGFVLLVCVVLLSVWFTARERADAVATQKILLTEDQLSNILSSTRQAESGQRGYLLTGNKLYLKPYDTGRAALGQEMQALRATLAGDPQGTGLPAIQNLLTTKLVELATTIALAQSGDHAGALAIVNTGVGMTTMVQLRDLIASMQKIQSAQLTAHQSVDRRNGWMVQIATSTVIFGTILLAWFAIRENRLQNAQLRAAELSLLAANEALESKVAERTRTLAASEAALAVANTSLEARVAERSRELDRIFKLSTDVLAVADFDGRFRNVSPAWTQITGWPAEVTLARTIGDFVHPEDHEASTAASDALRDGAPMVDFENRIRCAGDTWRWLAWRAVPMLEDGLIYAIGRDVTQEKAREEQLRQSQKMEIVGQLTGGIAHDFNNLLTIIMGSLELLQRDLKDEAPKVTRRIEAAMGGAKRAAALTHRLLAFSRRQPLAPQQVDANRLIAGMSDMLHRTLGETIAVEFVTAGGLWQALADPNQLENAVLNLAVNARDAMPDGGHITIETQNAHLDDAYAARQQDVQPGQYVLIAITDTGTGMTAAVKEKVFEPFFTTKPQGQGTGLGLAQVYGFIKQTGGHVAIYSEPDQGTTVKLYLPRLRAAAAAEPPPSVIAWEPGRAAGETVLLVEDEEEVRHYSRDILEELGYRVFCAENAAAALDIFNSTSGIDMLFTDVVLTGKINGRQLADEVLARRPDIIVLFTTGYTRNAIIHHGRLDEGVNFIGKPFTASTLGHKVRKLFDTVRVKQDELVMRDQE